MPGERVGRRGAHRPAVEALANVPWSADDGRHLDAIEYLHPSPLADFTPDVRGFAESVPFVGNVRDVAEGVMHAVRDRLAYEKRVTAAETRASEALSLGRGVWPDAARESIAVTVGVRPVEKVPEELVQPAVSPGWSGSLRDGSVPTRPGQQPGTRRTLSRQQGQQQQQ